MRSSKAFFVMLAGFVACTVMTACEPNNGDCLIGDASCTSGGTSSSSSSGGGSCGNTGKEFFETNVRAIVAASCAECHSAENASDDSGGPNFLGSSSADYYDKLTARSRYVSDNPAGSVFLYKGQHTGPPFSAEQHSKVSEWLTIEANERFGDCTGIAPSNCKSADALLAEFGACMTLEDWKASNMHEVSTQSSTFGQCHGCHDKGQSGNYMTRPNSDFEIGIGFTKMKIVSPMLNLVAWPENGAAGECPDIQQSYRWRDKGSEGTHPKYILEQAHLDALDAWFTLTYTKWKNGACPAP